MILAGDVGGTKVNLALYEFFRGRLREVYGQRYAAAEFDGLERIVEKFFTESGIDDEARSRIVAACFGVPGPVQRGRLKLTNLSWELDSRKLGADLKLDSVYLINDLEANGYGVRELEPEQLLTLSRGDPSSIGNRGLISAGTGLGEALLIWNGQVHVPTASEGGHGDFAPRSEEEIDLLRYLWRKVGGRVSYERVISGMGLTSIYDFYRDVKGMEEPAWLKERMASEDPNAVIGELGQSGANELCVKALEMFISAYGAEAGNLALRILATGGIYLGGGIAPKLVAKLKDGGFMRAFTDKGRLSGLLEETPVHVILESRAALMGAAAYAEAQVAASCGHSVRAASAACAPAPLADAPVKISPP